MKIKLSIFFILLVFGLQTYSQAQKDSISNELSIEEKILIKEKEIEDYQVKDTHRVNLIVKYSLYLEHSLLNNNIEPLLLEALDIARTNKYPLGIARCLNLLSTKYHENSMLDTSMTMTLEAIKILEKLDVEPDDILDAYTNLSTIYITTQEYKKALDINLKTLKIIQSIEPTLSHARIYFYTALCCENLNKYKEAEGYLLQAKAIATKFNFPGGIMIANGSLAEMFNKLEEYEKAVPLVKETIVFAENTGQLPILASSKYILGSSYLGLKQYNKAIENFYDAKQISEQIGSKNLLDKIYNGLYNAYLEQGKYKLALDYYIMATQITDSLFNLEKNAVLDDLKTKYGTNEIKKEKEILDYNKEVFNIENKKSDLKHKYVLEKSILKIKNKTINNVIKIGVLSFVLIFILVLVMLNRLKYLKRQKSIIDKQNDERKILLKEIHHRVKNNFQIICSVLKLQSFDEENEVVEKAFQEAINRIHAMSNVHELIYQQEQFSLINSIEYFKLLVNSLKESSGNSRIEFNLDSSIEVLSLPVLINLGISVNELVTNSIKYAFDDTIDQPIISIKLYEKNGQKFLEYIDNGIGFKGERKKTSFGMELIGSIIEKIDGELIQKEKEKAHFYIKF